VLLLEVAAGQVVTVCRRMIPNYAPY